MSWFGCVCDQCVCIVSWWCTDLTSNHVKFIFQVGHRCGANQKKKDAQFGGLEPFPAIDLVKKSRYETSQVQGPGVGTVESNLSGQQLSPTLKISR